MARRLKSATFDELTEIAARLPWWAGLALAIMAYVVLHLYAVADVAVAKTPAQMADAAIRNAVKGFALVGQYLIPIVFLAGAFASALEQRRRRRDPQAHNVEPEPPRIEPESADTVLEIPQDNAHGSLGVDHPLCPRCSRAMIRRVGVLGSQAGREFWGCSGFPDCRGTLPAD